MRLSDEQLLARAGSVLHSRPGAPAVEIRPESTFRDLGLDSLDALGLMFDLETEFGVTLPENEATQVATVGQLLQVLRIAVDAVPSNGPPSIPSPTVQV